MASSSEKHDMRAYAPPSLFQPHRAREAIRDAHKKIIPPLLGYYAGLSSVPITRFVTPMNFDFVWIDWEHTSCNVETMTTMVHEAMFISGGRTMPFVRVPGHDHAAIGYALDAGASLVIPQVETVEEAKHVVSAAKYGTKQNGTRSAPPFRFVPGLTDTPAYSHLDFHKSLNEQAAIMIQIESLKGIDNLDEILTQVPDIDIVWLGSLDARVSMNLVGNFGLPNGEPEWDAAREKFMAILDKHDKPYGGFAFSAPPFGSPEAVKKAAERMSFIITAADVTQLCGMATGLQEAKEAIDFWGQGKKEENVQNGNGNGKVNGSH